jgi:ATP-dependent Clp protease ATP-binding subunit ClpA
MGETDRFERFTERARRVLTLAQEEARGFNHNYIGTEHLLLGIARDRDMVSAQILGNLGVSLATLRGEVEAVVGRGDKPFEGEVDYTPRANKVLELARDEATRLGHTYIGTEHLLLGMVLEGEGIAAGLLRSLGVDFDRVFHEMTERSLIAHGPTERGRAKDNVVTFRVDDLDLAAIDALVEAGLRTTRSDATAWLVRMGIDANAELFEKVFATANEIRRLRQEVLTAGIRHQVGRTLRAQTADPALDKAPAGAAGAKENPPATTEPAEPADATSE